MKRIKPFKSVSGDKNTVQALLDKGEKIFASYEDSDVIYSIKSVGTKAFKQYNGTYLSKEVFFTAKNNALPIGEAPLFVFTGASQTIKTLRKNKKPAAKARSNYVGIELEFISSEPSLKLMERIVAAKLTNYITVTYDHSIEQDDYGGYETEIKILAREAIVFQVLKKFLKLIPEGSYVNKSCGLHVHLDMRNRDKDMAYKCLYQALPYLTNLVEDSRLDNDFCRLNHDNELSTFEESLNEDRYQAINPHAYDKYKTLEVRLKESTLNFREASSWVRDLIDIVNDKKKSRRGVSFFNIRSAANTAA